MYNLIFLILSFVFMGVGLGLSNISFIFTGLFIVFAMLVINKVSEKNKNESEYNQLMEIFNKVNGFKPTQQYISQDKNIGVAIDEFRNKVCFVEKSNGYNVKIFSFADILKSDILVDGGSVSSSTRASQIGGALLGGLLAGGAGAIIGGLGAKKTTNDTVGKVQLQITVNDMNKSFYRITFCDFPNKVTKDDPHYQAADKSVTHWHNLMTYLINNDSEVDNKKNSSVSDELKTLAELLEKDLLTTEEFQEQKKKLLEK